MTKFVTEPARRLAHRLRFPQLLLLTAVLLAVDLLVPDPIPWLDEAVLGLLTVLLATWRKRDDRPSR